MGHLVFWMLHLAALIFGMAGLFLTIPLHLIYSAAKSRPAASPIEPAPTEKTHVRCPACMELVRNDARKCKHCGAELEPVKTPSKPLTNQGSYVPALIGLGFVAFVAVKCNPANTSQARDESAPQESTTGLPRKAACAASDAWCTIERLNGEAERACAQAIEDKARFSMKWVNRFLEPKFSRAGRLRSEPNTLILRGDAAEFQNAQGNFVRGNYTCLFSVTSMRVTESWQDTGKLSNSSAR